MRLVSLELRSAPGLPHGLSLAQVSPGLVLLVGPNASGKSTLGRTLGGTLWPAQAPERVDAVSTWHSRTHSALHRATLVFSSVHWDPSPPPLPAELSRAWSLDLAGLLRSDARTDRDMAQEVRRQLDGGVDLDALQATLSPRSRPLPSQRRPLEEVRRELWAHQEAMDSLAAEEESLETHRRALAEALDAPAALEGVRQALRRLELDAEVGRLRERLSALPSDLERLPEDAVERVQELRRAVTQARRDLEARQQQHARASGELRQLAFPGREPGEAELAHWRARAEDLVEVEAALVRQREALALAEGAETEAGAQVWVASRAHPGAQELETLDRAAQELLQARHTAQALQEVLDALPEARSAEAVPEGARVLLREWLSAPRPLARPRPRGVLVMAVLGLLLGLVLVMAGLALAWLLSPWWALAPLGLGALLTGLGLGHLLGRLRTEPQAASPAQALEQRYRQAGHPLPESWTHQAVGQLLDRLDQQHARSLEARHRGEVRAAQQARLERATRAEAQARQVLDQLTRDLGLRADLGALPLLHQARRLQALATTRTQRARLEAAVEELEERAAALRQPLARQVQDLGVPGLPEPRDGASLHSILGALERRRADLLQQRERVQRAQEEAERAQVALERAEAALTELLGRCGEGAHEPTVLAQRARQRTEWVGLREELAALQREQARLPEVHTRKEALERHASELALLCEALPERQARVTAIEERLRLASSGHTLQELSTREALALDELARARDQALDHHARQALLGWLRQTRDQHHTPTLLRQARAWLLRFTRGRHELQVDGQGRWTALDLRTGRTQGLSQLSDGTRVQLLLAARLAWIEHAEAQAEPIPLFLDEVLSTADPERFGAVGRAVLELVASGRQVLYATADPAEVAAWRLLAEQEGHPAPQVLVLGPSATASLWEDPPEPPRPTRVPPPPPDGDALAWARALDLTRPTLHLPAAAWPLPLVHHDALDRVHAWLQQGLTTWGQLQRLAQLDLLPVSPAHLARGEALEQTLQALRVGRGRPVSWEVVQASGAITSSFEDRVRALLPTHGHDASCLLAAVEELPRFRASRVDSLREHLLETGHLDPRQPLDEEAVVERVLVGLRPRLERDELRIPEVRQTVAWVRGLVGL